MVRFPAYIIVFIVKKGITVRNHPWQGRKDIKFPVKFGIYPSQWPFSGDNEIQHPKRKNVLIHYEKLRELLAIDSYDLLKEYQKGWVEKYLDNGSNSRADKRSKSIAGLPFRVLKSGLIFQTNSKGSYLLSPAPCSGLRNVISTKPAMATPIRTMKAVW